MVDILTCFLSFLLLGTTVVSVICAFIAYDHQKERAKKESACELAKYYAQNIVRKIEYVNKSLYVIERDVNDNLKVSGPMEEIKKRIPFEKLEIFDKHEMEKIFIGSESEFSHFEVSMLITNPVDQLRAERHLSNSIAERKELINMLKLFPDPKVEGEKMVDAEIVREFLDDKHFKAIFELLDEFEWFAMMCHYGLADEEMLYQSLHTSYLEEVWFLSMYISGLNKSNSSNNFTNVIWLFNEWKKRKIDEEQKAELRKKEIVKQCVVIENKIKNSREELEELAKEIKEISGKDFTKSFEGTKLK